MRTEQIKNLIGRLLPAFPGFASGRSEMVRVPLNHLLCGFVFHGSSYSKTSFRVEAVVQPLYVPADTVVLLFAKRLRNAGTDVWEWTPDMARVIEEIRIAIASQGLSHIDQVRRPLDVADRATTFEPARTMKTEEAIAYSLLYSDRFDEGLGVLEQFCARLARELRSNSPAWMVQWQDRNMKLLDLLKTNPPAVKARLQEWENETIAKLKLDALPR